MDYFFMNEIIFKIILSKHKKFVLNLFKSIGMEIVDYEIFDVPITNKNQKVDILLFSNNLIINFQFNKNEISLKRNEIYINCIKSIMSDYQTIQLNINTFYINEDIENDRITIKNLYKNNEYIDFLTNKYPLEFKTKNKDILKVISFFKKIDLNIFKDDILNEQRIKKYLDDLIK